MPEYIRCGDDAGSISISEEVIISVISGSLNELEGFGGSANLAMSERLGLKSSSRGISLVQTEDGLTADIYMLVRYGFDISKVAEKAQEAVASAVESVTVIPLTVNIHVTGISFERAEIK